MPDLDITINIKLIENLKSRLLDDTADLFASMLQSSSAKSSDRLDILADIIITTHLLSQKLGSSHNALDAKVLSKLKLLNLQDSTEMKFELKELYNHLNIPR